MEEFLSNIILSCYQEICMEDGIFETEKIESKNAFSYLKNNGQFIYDDLLFLEVYSYLSQISNSNKDKYSLKKVVKYLKKNFLSYNKRNKNKEKDIRFLEENDLDEVIYRFQNNSQFGLDLLKATYYNFSNINLED